MKVCQKCGNTERGKRGDCKFCARIRAAAWAANNPERKISYDAGRRAKNGERIKAYNAEYARRQALKELARITA
jgi:hypothetical protein